MPLSARDSREAMPSAYQEKSSFASRDSSLLAPSSTLFPLCPGECIANGESVVSGYIVILDTQCRVLRLHDPQALFLHRVTLEILAVQVRVCISSGQVCAAAD